MSAQGSKSEIHFRKEGGAIEGREGGRLRIAFKYLFSAWWNSRAASPTSGARLRWYLRRRSAKYYHYHVPPATPRLVNGNFHRNFATARENLLAVRATVREAARSPTDSTDPTLFQTFHFCAQLLYLASRRTNVRVYREIWLESCYSALNKLKETRRI